MKSICLHVFYLTIIAFLSYNYWSSVQAFKAFEHLDRQLDADYQIIEKSSATEFNKIEKYYFNYSSMRSKYVFNQTKRGLNATNSLIDFMNDTKEEFIKINGGLDSLNENKMFNGESKKATKIFFSDAKINEIKTKLIDFSHKLLDSINNERITNSMKLPKLITDDNYWQMIKYLPANAALAQLSLIENKIKLDEIIIFNYQYREICEDVSMLSEYDFMPIIKPYSEQIIEGNTFEADVYIGFIAKNIGANCRSKVNGHFYDIRNGYVHFKSEKETVGIKTINAEFLIKNPLTGVAKTTNAIFEYQVLPKCRRDCQ